MVDSLIVLDKLLKSGKKIPKNFRFYYILNGKHFFVNDGVIKAGFENIHIHENMDRDHLLSIYGKMEFIFDELIRLLLMNVVHDEKSHKLLYILSIVPLNRKIRLFLDWNVFGKEFTQKLSRLFEVKNDLIHCIDINEIKYRKTKSLSLARKNDLIEFKNDLQSSWEELLTVYIKQIQKTPLDSTIKLVKEFQTKPN